MSQLKFICIFLYFVAYHVQADKYTDENRPYEFGFTIEGEQHRHEKKDENGIIMGEFGFITADGVYHVTVYATDENGNFKIISMKNIRVKPYPTAATQNNRQGHSLTLPSAPETKTKTTVQANNRAQQIIQDKNSGPAKTCSHCSVPTTTTPLPKVISGGLQNRNGQPKENQHNTQIQSNVNSFNQEFDKKSQQDSQQNIFPQSVDNSYNQKPFTTNSQSTIGQQEYKQPSREINTPLISSYPQSSGLGPNNPQVPGISQTNSQNYPQPFENDSQNPNQGQQHQQKLPGSSALTPNAGEPYQQQLPGSSPLNPTGGEPYQQQLPVSSPQNPNAGELYQQQLPGSSPLNPNAGELYQQQLPGSSSLNSNAGVLYQQQIPGSSPLNSNAGELYQQQIPGSSPLHSNAGELYSGQPRITELGKTYKSNAFNSNNYPRIDNENKNLPNNNNIKDGSGNIEPPNGINTNRQPKSFNDILESVNPETGYNIDTQSNGSPQPNIGNVYKKPVLVAAQMQIVDKDTDIYHKNLGENDGLPQGLTKGDMTQLLYTFNYTLGFHGHHEKGYINGAKIGYYFVTGRNGIRMRVDYVADETGFHPKISQEVLDISSDDVPKPETEKDEKYGLKGYEFKWLYYPVNSP